MASRKGYTSLPADSEENAEQPGAVAAAAASSGGGRGDEASGRDATSDSATKKEAAGEEVAGESPSKDSAADPTGPCVQLGVAPRTQQQSEPSRELE